MHATVDLAKGVLAAASEEDREAYLTALSNLMSVRMELRETEADVERAVALLLAENASLNRTEGVARAEWMMGRMQMYRGRYDDAAALLTRVMPTVGDDDTSIRADVHAIEALLLADRPDEAFALARELASAAAALDELEPSRRHKLTRQVSAFFGTPTGTDRGSGDRRRALPRSNDAANSVRLRSADVADRHVD